MTTQNLTAGLIEADRAAQENFENDDLHSPVAPCPARQDELFIVPVRYALSEETTDHDSLQPPLETASHPMALRYLRRGFLYLWQGEGPLRCFAVGKNGTLQEQGLDDSDGLIEYGDKIGFVLNKRQDAWLMHSEFPLPADRYTELQSAAGRQKHMRRIPLNTIAGNLKAAHCPPLEHADQVIAELLPEVRDRAIAADYQRNEEEIEKGFAEIRRKLTEEPSMSLIQAWIHVFPEIEKQRELARRYPVEQYAPGEWSEQGWDVRAAESWLRRVKSEAGELFGVFAALDDVPGALLDLNHEQMVLAARNHEWEHENAFKSMMAGFINSLIEEDGAELSDIINYRYRDRIIPLTPEQGKVMLNARNQLRPVVAREAPLDRDRELGRIGSREYRQKRQALEAEIEEIVAPVRAIIPEDLYDEITRVVIQYQTEKKENLEGSRQQARVAENIRLQEMRRWLSEEVEPHYGYLQERQTLILQDTRAFLPRHGHSLWYVDYDRPDHCDELSSLALNSLSELCSTHEGVVIATDLIRAADPQQPFSLMASGFTPSLENNLDIVSISEAVEGALTGENSAAINNLMRSMIANEKLGWLRNLSGPEANSWDQLISRLGAAFMNLELEHIKGGQTGNPLQNLPKPLLCILLIARLGGQAAISITEKGYALTGPAGQKLWDWGKQAGQHIRNGTVHLTGKLAGSHRVGGFLSICALVLHGLNVWKLERQDLEYADTATNLERYALWLNTGAAFLTVLNNIASSDIKLYRLIAEKSVVPITQIGLSALTGILASVSGLTELASLYFEMQRNDSYWSDDHWALLSRAGGQAATMGAQAKLGYSALHKIVVHKWQTQKALQWFLTRSLPLGWLLLFFDMAYLTWRLFFHKNELQQFLYNSYWGINPRWTKSAEGEKEELQALIDLLFQPKVETTTELHRFLSIKDGGSSYKIKTIDLTLPAATENSTIAIYIAETSSSPTEILSDLTQDWINNLTVSYLPINQGMGLKLSAPIKNIPSRPIKVQIQYYSPMAMLSGAIPEGELIVGGKHGITYRLINDSIQTYQPHEQALNNIKPIRIVGPHDLSRLLKESSHVE